MSTFCRSAATRSWVQRVPAVVALGVAVVGFVAFVARPAFPVPVEDVSTWMPDRLPAVGWDRLYVATAIVTLLRPTVLVLLVGTSAGRRVLRRVTGWMSNTVLGGALAAVDVLVAIDLLALPVVWWGRTGNEGALTWFPGWFLERAQVWAVVGLLAAGLVLALRRWPRGWHWRFVLACTALAALVPLAADLDPFAGGSAPLADGPVRQAIEAAQDRAGIEEVPILVGSGSDAAELGAYVSGVGPSTKIILSTPLVEGFAPGRVAFVAMHEYAHREHLDVNRRVLGTAAGVVLGVWVIRLVLASEPTRRQVSRARAPAVRRVVIALTVVAVVHALAAPVSNLANRRAEAAADWRALETTADPESAIAMQHFLLRNGLVDPSPPAWYQAWLATYPTPAERVGLALRYAQLNGVDLSP